MNDTLSCAACGQDSGIVGCWDNVSKTIPCAACGAALYVYSDEDRDCNYWFGTERATDSASGLCQWCGTEHGLGCACAITPADQPDGGPDEEDGPWAEGWAERSGTPDQQSARKGLDELTRMAQEDGLYDDPAQQSPCQHEWAKVRHTIYYRCDKCLGIATLAADKT
jgi:hypothetical protein